MVSIAEHVLITWNIRTATAADVTAELARVQNIIVAVISTCAAWTKRVSIPAQIAKSCLVQS